MVASGPRPVWREPVAWLVGGLPLLVLLAAGVTVMLAQSVPADVSAAQVRRIAQIQVEDLALDREAARRGLRAELVGDPVQGRVEIVFGAADVAEDRLELWMLHPVSESHDRIVPLRRQGRMWHGHTAPWPAHDWELRLQAPRGAWRLTGRLPRRAARAGLRPAVSP